MVDHTNNYVPESQEYKRLIGDTDQKFVVSENGNRAYIRLKNSTSIKEISDVLQDIDCSLDRDSVLIFDSDGEKIMIAEFLVNSLTTQTVEGLYQTLKNEYDIVA